VLAGLAVLVASVVLFLKARPLKVEVKAPEVSISERN
jgi:hypothetical protein